MCFFFFFFFFFFTLWFCWGIWMCGLPRRSFFGMSRKIFEELCVTSQETTAKENAEGVASISKFVPTITHSLLWFCSFFNRLLTAVWEDGGRTITLQKCFQLNCIHSVIKIKLKVLDDSEQLIYLILTFISISLNKRFCTGKLMYSLRLEVKNVCYSESLIT